MTDDRPDRPSQSCTLVVFGASGDLNKRKLMPALYNLFVLGQLPEDFAVLSVARSPKDDKTFRDEETEQIQEYATQKVDPALWKKFVEHLYYTSGDFNELATYHRLQQRLTEIDAKHHAEGNAIFYLAVPPTGFAPVVEHLGKSGLTTGGRGYRRV
ncbi:MAG: glucose-6-phosphate dehydrogenase, partial [Myxococcaceae bacterium]